MHSYTYTYDPAGRLTQVKKDGVVVSQYTYDGNGNRLTQTGPVGTVTATYDNQDRLLQYGSTTYAYTANGELQSKTDTATQQTTAYTYDPRGNLLAAILPDGTHIDYLVDGANRRIGKKVNGTLVQGFLYDGSHLVAELDGAGNVVSRFVYGASGTTPEHLIKGGVAYRILTDQVGSVRLVVNAATGVVVERLDYDAFGNVTMDSNPGFQPFGFAGGLYDRDTGLVRFGVRDYDAATGRWTAKDALGIGGGSNLYAYVGNDPVNAIDPAGLEGSRVFPIVDLVIPLLPRSAQGYGFGPRSGWAAQSEGGLGGPGPGPFTGGLFGRGLGFGPGAVVGVNFCALGAGLGTGPLVLPSTDSQPGGPVAIGAQNQERLLILLIRQVVGTPADWRAISGANLGIGPGGIGVNAVPEIGPG
jgi:RHS repeat-associated protein